ncbi:hypothetical protein [Aneurinibacillus terranovensis]|uniref:hypothetical protein n=1 Tax=Aneurinibacillus terranovensis TaxID=278991 RepID=UPI000404EA3B|nr:hypothetical protein [Aneurinibacillus terranovensis]
MMMYVCISCYQLKHGDLERIDMNICENCAEELEDDKRTPLLSTIVPPYRITENDDHERLYPLT